MIRCSCGERLVYVEAICENCFGMTWGTKRLEANPFYLENRRLQSEISELRQERDRLKAVLDGSDALHTHILRNLSQEKINHLLGQWAQELRYENQTIQDAFLNYGQHAPICQSGFAPDRKCDCGFGELKAELLRGKESLK